MKMEEMGLEGGADPCCPLGFGLIQRILIMLQVLRDTTRRGHKLYHRTENDREICLADADSGKIVEINAEENLVQG